MKNKAIIIDASAMIALLRQEPGSEVVEKHLGHLNILSLSASETIFKMMPFIPPDTLESMILELVEIIPLNTEIAFLTARLKAETKLYGLSYADCACLALAKYKNLPVLTADKVWNKLEIGIKIHLIR